MAASSVKVKYWRGGSYVGLFLKHSDAIERVTLWGVNDGDSWLNGWPVKGRTNYPLLFDRSNKAKPAVDALLKLGREAK